MYAIFILLTVLFINRFTLQVCLSGIDANPFYHLVGYYLPPQVHYQTLYAPRPQILHHRAHAADAVRTLQSDAPSPLITNTITYTADPDADPDDALEVAQFHSQVGWPFKQL